MSEETLWSHHYRLLALEHFITLYTYKTQEQQPVPVHINFDLNIQPFFSFYHLLFILKNPFKPEFIQILLQFHALTFLLHKL